jgi:nitrile hydratase accessory protein
VSEALQLPDEVALMDGPSSLPRANGELVFSAPWEGRAVAIAVALVERLGLPWDAFRDRLVDAIAAEPERPYYESWAAALESLVVSVGLATPASLDTATPASVRRSDRDAVTRPRACR